MDTPAVVARCKLRYLDGEQQADDEVIAELAQTVADRLLIRLDADELPKKAESLVVEATMKCIRLRGYEGSTSESSADGGSISNTFVSDVLDSMTADIARLKEQVHRVGIKFI